MVVHYLFFEFTRVFKTVEKIQKSEAIDAQSLEVQRGCSLGFWLNSFEVVRKSRIGAPLI
jgi:hypothetical protein